MKLLFICPLAFCQPEIDRDRLGSIKGRGIGRISAACPAVTDRQLHTHRGWLLWSVNEESVLCCCLSGLHERKDRMRQLPPHPADPETNTLSATKHTKAQRSQMHGHFKTFHLLISESCDVLTWVHFSLLICLFKKCALKLLPLHLQNEVVPQSMVFVFFAWISRTIQCLCLLYLN